MRWVNFDIVNIQQTKQNGISVMVIKDVPINVDLICFVAPATIPTDLSGPDGNPLGKPGAQLQFAGPAILVDCTKDMALWKMQNEEIAIGPKPEEQEPLKPTPGKPSLKLIKLND
jgi:hypothetical protein